MQIGSDCRFLRSMGRTSTFHGSVNKNGGKLDTLSDDKNQDFRLLFILLTMISFSLILIHKMFEV